MEPMTLKDLNPAGRKLIFLLRLAAVADAAESAENAAAWMSDEEKKDIIELIQGLSSESGT